METQTTIEKMKTYADRVNKQWRFELPTNYNRDREVSIKLKDPLRRADIYTLLDKTKIPLQFIEGIVQRPGRNVEIACITKETAIKLAEKLRDAKEVMNVIAQGDAHTNLSVGWVPIHFPQESIVEALKRIGLVISAVHGRDRFKGMRDGRRIFKVLKKDLMEAKPPSYIHFGHLKFVLEYEGQVKTCHYCDETGHLVKDCPNKVKNQDVVNESWKAVGETRRTFGGVSFRQMKRTSPERYSPSKEDFPELPNNSGALNNRHSTPFAKTKPPKVGTSKGQLIDHFDGSIVEFSDEEDSLDEIPKDTLGTDKCPSSGGQKRPDKRERSEDSTLSTAIPPGQRPKGESTDSEMLEADETDVFKVNDLSNIKCSCGDILPKPSYKQLVYCNCCPMVHFKCRCLEENIKSSNRLKQGMCDSCDFRYVPDAHELNATSCI